MLPEIIESDRFRLRPFRAEDAEKVFAYANDEAFLRYLPIPLPYTRDTADEFLRTQAALDWHQHPSWAIEMEGAACGGVNIRFFTDHRVAEFGYAVAQSRWRQGIATEAARLMVGAAFDVYPGLIRVRARADARNAASIRVMEKLGMQREALLRKERLFRGELADEVVYGMLRDEWRP